MLWPILVVLVLAIFLIEILARREEKGSKQIARFLSDLECFARLDVEGLWGSDGHGRFRRFAESPYEKVNPTAEFCPVTWLCFKQTGKRFSHINPTTRYFAAERIGLFNRVAKRINKAVNTPGAYLRGKNRELRYQIQEILGISDYVTS